MTPEEERFVEALRNNDSVAVQHLSRRIVPLIKNKLFSFQDWEDAQQQCVLEIIEAVRRIEKIKSFWGLARKITITSVIDINRRYVVDRSRQLSLSGDRPHDGENRATQIKDAGPTPDVSLEGKDMFLYIYQRLGKECQQIFRSLFILELDYEETASKLDISEGSLRVRLHRCRQKALQIRDRYLAE